MKADPRDEERVRATEDVTEIEGAAIKKPDAGTRPQAKRLDFLEAGKMTFKKTLKDASDFGALRRSPYGLRPIIMMTVISSLIAFDTVAFRQVSPLILRELDIRIPTIISVLGIVNFLLIFTVIAVAYYADRHPRVPLLGIFSMIAGGFSLLTGHARGIGSLGAFRVFDQAGKAVAATPVVSLVPDFYPPEVRGKAFALWGVLSRSMTLFAPLIIGYVAAATYWRVPFYATGPLLVIAGLWVTLRLKEPVRGYMERKAMGTSEEVALKEEEPPSLGEAWRTVWSIRTLRRFFIAQVWESGADFVFIQLFVLFLFDRYGLTVINLGWLLAGIGVFQIAGGFLGGGVVDVLMKRRPQRVLTFLGILSLTTAIAFIPITTGPDLWILIAFFVVVGFASSLLGPASAVIYAQIVPAHVRTLGGAVQNLADIPGILIGIAAVGALFERYGYQGTLAALVPLYLIGAVIKLTAAGFFERDMRAAFAANIAAEEWRAARDSGRGKLLVCRDVDVEYDGVQVLFGVDFDVEEGDLIALLGTNGAGKSTLLRAISGVQEAASGAIVFDGRDVTHMPPHEIALRGVIHMPGGRGVFPGLSVKDNLLMGAWMLPEEEVKERIAEVFRIFPALKERESARASSLSGGEQQMVSLAQAFLSKPRLLMIDELSLGLSPAAVQQMIEVVKRIHETGVTVIVVEQSVNVALTIAKKAIFMEKGEVRFTGETTELLRRPDILRAVYVKGSGALTERGPKTAVKGERELRRYELERSRRILEAESVSKSYGGVIAVNDVSLMLREGEALGLIGPNGAGKTTLFDVISGYQTADRGRISFDGRDVTELRAEERARLGLVRRFQDARLFPALTVYENLLVALDRKLDVRNMIATALQLPQVRKSEKRVRLRAERLLELLELGAYRDKFVKELSTGLRRITDLACVLATEPKVLLLDEPSSGIAQAEAEGLAPLLRRVRFETACSMLVIEHDMPLISAISDELVALDQGAVVTRGLPDDVLNDERVIESYLGTSEEIVKRSGV